MAMRENCCMRMKVKVDQDTVEKSVICLNQTTSHRQLSFSAKNTAIKTLSSHVPCILPQG